MDRKWRDDPLGLSRPTGLSPEGVCVCIHMAVADAMNAEGWQDRPVMERLAEHRRRCHAILAGEMQCPAWETCKVGQPLGKGSSAAPGATSDH